MEKGNVIYKSLRFKCEKINEKTGKECNSHLHLINQFSSTLEFKCFICGAFTCMSYEIANVINQDTGYPPKKEQ